jgi:Holliday junction resolvase RusA-like endonuclease
MTICLDLSLPPSTNALHRAVRGRVIKSKKYRDWITQAGKEIMAQRAGQKKVTGHFRAHLIVSNVMRRSNSDLDNRSKAVLDLLQAHDLIDNDCLMDHFETEWGSTKLGCRIFIWPME